MQPLNSALNSRQQSTEGSEVTRIRKPVASAVELRPETRRKLAYSWLRGTPINNLAKITSREYGIPIKSFEVESAVREELSLKPKTPAPLLVTRAA